MLYIVTTNRIVTVVTVGKGSGGPARLLDSVGAAVGCVAFGEEGEMIVGRDDAVYVYQGESKSTVYAFEGPPPCFGEAYDRQKCSGIDI